jgi:YtkA-like
MRSNTASQPVSRRSTLARFAVPAAAVILLTGHMMFSRTPRDVDYSRTRMSEGGIYRGTIRPQGDPIPQGRLHSWTLHLETASGTPVDSAFIAVDGGMPQHGHGLPTKPVVTRHAGNGDHVVDGMKFNMGGWWIVKFRVGSSAGTDSLLFNIKL